MRQVRVRIPVAVDASGQWAVASFCGTDRSSDESNLQLASGRIYNAVQPLTLVWVEANVPVPEPAKTVEGEAT